MNINNTSLPENYSKGLYEEKNYDLAADHTDKIFYTIFTGVGALLQQNKQKDRPVAFIFDKINGEVIAVAVVQYFENENKENPGNWNMFWSFDEADVPENAIRISLKDPLSHSYFISVAGNKYGIIFHDSSCLTNLLTYALEQLYKWLDENAKENEEVVIEQDSIFQARVAVENGQKVMAIEPAGEIKMMIKDDASIEK